MQSSDGDSDNSILLPVKQKKVKTDSKMSKNASVSGSLPGRPLDAPKKDLVYNNRVKTPGQGDQSIEQEVQYSSEEEQGKETVQMKSEECTTDWTMWKQRWLTAGRTRTVMTEAGLIQS